MKSTLLIFVVGIGIGKNDPESNPFVQNEYKFLSTHFAEVPTLENQRIEKENKFIFPVDANLGVEGLPQSGTGQTSIFCGVNASKIVGKHFGPFPYSTLIPIIDRENIFRKYSEAGKSVCFANAYPQIFFDYVNAGKRRLSVTTLSCIKTGVRLNTSTDLRSGRAVTAEIDNSRWVEKLNYNLPIVKPETAARRLLKLASQNHLTLFEFFFSDHFGHKRQLDIYPRIMSNFDRFLLYIISNIDNEMSLLVCSDHGNFEDMSVKTHTRNPAFTLSAGRGSEYLAGRITDLSQIQQAVLENDS